MIRENQKYLNMMQVLLDIIMIYLAFICAFCFRFYILEDGSISVTFEDSIVMITALVPVYLGLYSAFDLYAPRRIKTFTNELFCIIASNIIAVFVLIAELYFIKEMNFSRQLLSLFPILCTTFTLAYRGVLRYILRYYRKNGFNQKHCIVIGTAPVAKELIDKLLTHTTWGYHITGCLYTGGCAIKRAVGADTALEDFPLNERFCGIPILGHISELEAILSQYHVDTVMIATDEYDAVNLGKILRLCEKAGVKVNMVPYYYKYIPARPYMDDLDGLPIIDTRHVPLDNLFKAFTKRCFDIIFSICALILTSPLLLFSAIMVKLSSPGPILFKQERIGKNGKEFGMYKFRSMRVQSEAEENVAWTVPKDPRKTRWGSFMRKTSIDELPQFFNVLRGDMSVIGPRPERPFFVDKFKEEIPRYMIKHQVRPGITGWAQVNGLRGDTSIVERIKYDLYYIENWTIGLDLKIVFLTIIKGFINKNAY